MAILVNWFEVTFDRKGFELPYCDVPTWEEATAMLRARGAAEIVRSKVDDSVRLHFVTGRPTTACETENVLTHSDVSIIARIVETNLGQHFKRAGAQVVTNRWGMEATREVEKFAAAGVTLRQGIHAK